MKLSTLYIIVSFGSLVSADNFANFFDDDNCQDNGGIGVNIYNPGCLKQNNRGSVYLPLGTHPLGANCLVMTKESDECNCQADHIDFQPTGFCQKLPKEYNSYRFIDGPCAEDNC